MLTRSVLLLPIISPTLLAADWPQWRGPARDGVSAETGLLTAWPAGGPRLLWKVPGGGGYSCPAIAGGRLFTLVSRDKDEIVLCLDAKSGKELWTVRSDADRPDDFGSGPRATPTVDGDRVYTLGASGSLMCLQAADGKSIWSADILKQFSAENLRWGVSGSPLVEGDLLIVNSGGRGASCVAFDKKTGKVVWAGHDDLAGYAAPTAITVDGVRQIVFFTGDAVLGVSPTDGAEHWRIPWKTSYDCNIATPVWSAKDKLLFVSSGYDKGCAAVRLAGKAGKVAAEIAWQSRAMRNHHASCVLHDGKLYGFDGNGPAVLKCLELTTGRTLWTDRSIGKGSLMLADGHLIALSEEGELALIAADPAGYKEKARCKPLDSLCWTMPVLSGGRLYLRNESEILCLQAGK
jgi:outer membrane protein assembly factor BamB